jgi:chromosomal replication initiator protein
MQKAGNTKPRIAYMSGEAFTAQYVTSLRQRKAEEFRRRLKSVDLWLVDDIQFIAGKEQTKEEFFHTFNLLQSAGKQIVICSDRSPRELRAMDERLQSRFESGLVADIAPPDLETRLAILQKKAENESTRVPDDVLLYMARLVQSNIRTLEGALVKLVAYASLMNSPVTTQMAEGILERYFIAAGAGELGKNAPTTAFSMPMPTPKGAPLGGGSFSGTPNTPYTQSVPTVPGYESSPSPATSPIKLTPELIRRVVAKRFNVPLDDLNSKRRDRDVTNARQVAMHLLRELTDISLPGIGQLFGGRDHTTVIHACDRIKSQIGMDDEMRLMVEGILEEMGKPTPKRDQVPPARHVGQTFEQGLFDGK